MVKRVLILFGLCLLIFAILYTDLLMNTVRDKRQDSREVATYHLQIIAGGREAYFEDALSQGALTAGDETDTFVEFVTLAQWNHTSLREAVEKGIMAGVDGIAFSSSDPTLIADLQGLSESRGTALVLYESSSADEGEIPKVGSNAYSIGMAAGNLAAQAGCRQALLVLDADGGSSTQYRNLNVQGVLEGAAGQVSITDTALVDTGLLAVEELLRRLASPARDFDTVICLQESLAPVLVQSIVDNDQVGEIRLIGYGASPATLEYIRRGVLEGVVCPDAYDIGYGTVHQLISLLAGDSGYTYSAGQPQTITRENMDNFLYTDMDRGQAQ